MDEAPDSRRLSEPGLLRPACVRCTGRSADVLLDEREEAHTHPGRSARRPAPGSHRVRPGRHSEAALRRRNEVLHAMLTAGSITPRQYADAVGDSLGVKPGTLYSAQRHPNFFGWAAQQLVDRFGTRRVEAGGLQVRTTLDPRMQYAARNAAASVLRLKTDPAAAVVAIDPRTGAVKAMVSYLPDGRTMKFNLASQSGRTAVSSFKPFTLAAAINEGDSVYSAFSGPS